MYIYNVTINIDESVHDAWFKWMKEQHIPDMLSTGKFSKAKMSQLMVKEEMGGITYTIQYTTDSIETLQEYYNENATALQDEGLRLFKNKFVAFRTEMKVITELFSMSAKN